VEFNDYVETLAVKPMPHVYKVVRG